MERIKQETKETIDSVAWKLFTSTKMEIKCEAANCKYRGRCSKGYLQYKKCEEYYKK